MELRVTKAYEKPQIKKSIYATDRELDKYIVCESPTIGFTTELSGNVYMMSKDEYLNLSVKEAEDLKIVNITEVRF